MSNHPLSNEAPAVRFVYVTARDREEALRIGRDAVERRLAACANILDGVTSFYRWEGRMQEDREAVLVLKTTAERLDGLTAHIKSLHSYSCPCIVALPILGGNPDFLSWIAGEC